MELPASDRDDERGQFHTLTVTDVNAIQSSAQKLGESPLFEDWVEAVEEYRRQNNTVPDAG